jgi:hypothetical protein
VGECESSSAEEIRERPRASEEAARGVVVPERPWARRRQHGRREQQQQQQQREEEEEEEEEKGQGVAMVHCGRLDRVVRA